MRAGGRMAVSRSLRSCERVQVRRVFLRLGPRRAFGRPPPGSAFSRTLSHSLGREGPSCERGSISISRWIAATVELRFARCYSPHGCILLLWGRPRDPGFELPTGVYTHSFLQERSDITGPIKSYPSESYRPAGAESRVPARRGEPAANAALAADCTGACAEVA